MNREIKFRVWDKVDYRSSSFTLLDLIDKKIEFTSDCHVMRFTGLRNEDGDEIYEGDILKEDQLFQVVWDAQWAKFKLQSIGNIQYPEWNRGVKMVIVGNIFENPELLS